MPAIQLPNLHKGQQRVIRERSRFNVVRCGRRWGKDILQNCIAADAAARGFRAGLFAPRNDQLMEPFDAIAEILTPCKRRSSRTEGVFRTKGGGHIDIWTLDDNPLAGRGHEYDVLLGNEMAFSKNIQTLRTWREAMKPTLLTRRGQAWMFSTPFGIEPENFFYALCTDPKLGFKEHHAPSLDNPYVPADEIERERETNYPLVFQQEFLAEFVDMSGVAFFAKEKLLTNGEPIPFPAKCDGVYAVLDTAVKAGKEHDGTAVTYYAVSQYHGTPLLILDWDIVQIEGSLLEVWLPTVFERMEQLAVEVGARNGAIGCWIEDTSAGIMLLQQGRRRGWNVHAIDSAFVALGKDERAISVSGMVYQEKVKISEHAYNKTVNYKGVTRNHFLTQVTGFRVGDKDAHKRADDLTDCFTAGISIGLGNRDGY